MLEVRHQPGGGTVHPLGAKVHGAMWQLLFQRQTDGGLGAMEPAPRGDGMIDWVEDPDGDDDESFPPAFNDTFESEDE